MSVTRCMVLTALLVVSGLWSPVSGLCRDYPVTVVRVVDGDTVDVLADLGLGVSKGERVRLEGVYAAELGEAGGDAAREYLVLALRCPAGEVLTLRTDHDSRDKYGRLLGRFRCHDVDINEMVSKSRLPAGKGAAQKTEVKGTK